MDTVKAHVYVQGRVQGVFYRDWTLRQARALGLTGWVKNLSDGKVEAIFEGSKSAVEQVIEKCKEGPKLAKVEHTDIIWESPTSEFSSFEVTG